MKKNVLLLSTVGVAVVVAGIFAAKSLNNNPAVDTPVAAEQTATATADTPVATTTAADAHVNDKILATYNNGTPVYKSEIDDKLKAMFGGKLPEGKTDFDQFPNEIKENFINGFITSKLITLEVAKTSIADSADFKKQLAEAKEQLAQKTFIMNKVKELTTDAAIKQRYDQFAKEQSEKEEIKARHILVATEAEAKAIEEELKKGENFEEIAKNKSSDSSKSKGGDLGYFSKGQMVKQFEDAAFALKTGEISAPVKSDFGWHIIKVEDRRKMAVPSFEEVKQKFQDEVGQKAMQDYIKKLQSDAHIELKLSNTPAADAPKDTPSTTPPAADTPKDAPAADNTTDDKNKDDTKSDNTAK